MRWHSLTLVPLNLQHNTKLYQMAPGGTGVFLPEESLKTMRLITVDAGVRRLCGRGLKIARSIKKNVGRDLIVFEPENAAAKVRLAHDDVLREGRTWEEMQRKPPDAVTGGKQRRARSGEVGGPAKKKRRKSP